MCGWPSLLFDCCKSVGLIVGSLLTPTWFVCSIPVWVAATRTTETLSGVWSLTTETDTYQGAELSASVCSAAYEQGYAGDVPCVSGQVAIGLGISGAVLLAVSSALLLALSLQPGRSSGFWAVALGSSLLGGLAAAAGGATYFGAMLTQITQFGQTSGSNYGYSASCNPSIGPCLLLAGGVLSWSMVGHYCAYLLYLRLRAGGRSDMPQIHQPAQLQMQMQTQQTQPI